MNTKIQQFFKILILCVGILFFSKNGQAQCSSYNVTVSQTSDGQYIGDAVIQATVTGGGSLQSYWWLSPTWNNYYNNSSINTCISGKYCVYTYDSISGCNDSACITVVDTGTFNCGNLQTAINEGDSCFTNDVSLYTSVWGGSGDYSYLWNIGNTSSYIYNKTTGTYSVIVTDNVYGCKDTLYKSVLDDTCNFCDTFQGHLTENDSCLHNDLDITAYMPAGSGNYTFSWSTGYVHSPSYPMNNVSTISNVASGTYSVTITDNTYGCRDTLSITVVDDTCDICQYFQHYISVEDNCKSNDLKIYLWGSDSSNSSITYLWNTGATIQNLTNKSVGTYRVTITNATTSCKDTVEINVNYDSVYKCCTAYFYTNDSGNWGAATKDFYSYSYSSRWSVPITNYSWSFGDGTTDTGITASKTYTSTGSYTVCHYITDYTGCKDTMCLTVSAPPPGKNLRVYHYGSPYLLPSQRWVYIHYKNIGTTTENGIVEYRYPTGCNVTYTSITPTSNSGNKLTFNVGSLAPGQGDYIYLYMTTPSSFTVGSTKCDTAYILTNTNDVDSSNNVSYACQQVYSSYDPNDKIPNPIGLEEDGKIDPNTKEISYLIRFQNSGNYRTYKVRVEDDIDPSFDINTLMIGDVSHNYRLVKNGNKLVWYFDDIELTPKSQNESKSQGFIQYSLKLKNGLPLGTQIKNTAYIYFDANEAIITNTTKNTLYLKSTVSVKDNNNSDLDFTYHRNMENLSIESVKKMDEITIYDMNGRVLINSQPKAMKAEWNTSLPEGIYVVHVQIGENTVVKKIKF